MKTFKQFLDENILDDVLDLGSKFLYFWKNRWVINTKHGFERIMKRSKLTKDELKTLFRNAIKKLSKIGASAGDNILFFSKSLKQGFVSAVDDKGNLRLITFLPRGKDFPKPGTEKVVVEGIEEEIRIDTRIELE